MNMRTEEKYILAYLAMLAIIIAAFGLFGWGIYRAVLEVIALIAGAL